MKLHVSTHGTSINNVNSAGNLDRQACNILDLEEDFTVNNLQQSVFISSIKNNSEGSIFVMSCNSETNRYFTRTSLSTDAVKILDEPNAGGNSEISEVLSFELLHKCFKAKLLKTEKQVSYSPKGGSMTDYVCEILGTKLGVSVTRAMKHDGVFYRNDADRLLSKKLNGVIQSSRNSQEDWYKQVLHVWSMSNDVTNILIQAYNGLTESVQDNTVVLITTTTNASNFIYSNKWPSQDSTVVLITTTTNVSNMCMR